VRTAGWEGSAPVIITVHLKANLKLTCLPPSWRHSENDRLCWNKTSRRTRITGPKLELNLLTTGVAHVTHYRTWHPSVLLTGLHGQVYRWCQHSTNNNSIRMWVNAQRDVRPAEYRRCPLFNAAKIGWRPLVVCRALTQISLSVFRVRPFEQNYKKFAMSFIWWQHCYIRYLTFWGTALMKTWQQCR